MTSPSNFVFLDQIPPDILESALVVRMPAWIETKHQLLKALATGLNFPEYFGWNWDALEECLRDLSWIEAPRDIVLFHEQIPFPPDSDERSIYLAVLRDAVASWGCEQLHTLTVVFPTNAQSDVEIE